ncbi:MAG: TRAP transporter small permease [Deltaproteobacteria bacterium]|nr:TRAP transporter small permease [Deltaproteobacteria bacterium]
MRAKLDRLDAAIFSFEKKLVGALTLLMASVVFVDVAHRVFSRRPGRLATLLSGWIGESPESLDTFAAPAITFVVFVILVFGAIRGRAEAKGENAARGKAFVLSVGLTAILAASVQALIYLRPEGFVFAPYLALSALLWSGLIGASMATYSTKHLALEMGEKLWPKSLQPSVRSFAQLVAGGFALVLAVLGAMSVADHFQVWTTSPEAGLIPSVDLPKWLVFLVVPYAFGMIGLRFVARAFGLLTIHTPLGEGMPAEPQEGAK